MLTLALLLVLACATTTKPVPPVESVAEPERAKPDAVTQDHPKADPQRAPERSAPVPSAEPRLGVVEEPADSVKGWVEAEDKTYVGKVVACEGEKYDRSTVLGGGMGLNAFYLCLDIGTAFTKVQVDNLFDPVFFTYKDVRYRVERVRKNDVVRVKVNDGQALKVEMVKSVLD